MSDILKIEKLRFGYTEDKEVLRNIRFKVKKGEIISILGESGCGKSTLLKLIYGLGDANSGKIFYDGDEVTGPKFNLVPGHPEMKFVPKEFDLLDFVTVAENVGKYLSNFNIPLKKRTIKKALKTVSMWEYRGESPKNLSGGQRQRVSIARALATEPKVLLLDEPYSHLDRPLRFEIRRSLWQWAKETGCTILLATHDRSDSFGFSDRMIIMKKGRIIQKGTPEEVRNHPKSKYTASLLGVFTSFNSYEMKSLFQIEIPDGKEALVYPEEFEVSKKGSEFTITDIRFRGRDYLIEAVKDEKKIWFFLSEKPKESAVLLSIREYRWI